MIEHRPHTLMVGNKKQMFAPKCLEMQHLNPVRRLSWNAILLLNAAVGVGDHLWISLNIIEYHLAALGLGGHLCNLCISSCWILVERALCWAAKVRAELEGREGEAVDRGRENSDRDDLTQVSCHLRDWNAISLRNQVITSMCLQRREPKIRPHKNQSLSLCSIFYL